MIGERLNWGRERTGACRSVIFKTLVQAAIARPTLVIAGRRYFSILLKWMNSSILRQRFLWLVDGPP